MAAPTTPHTALRLALSLALASLSVACFDSDELRSSNEPDTSGGGETITPYADDTADTSDDNWTAEETGPSETTCRDAIDCLIECQADLIFNPQAEPDLSCFLTCDQGLSVEEAYLLFKLAECIGEQCTAEGECGGDATENECLICIASNGQDPQPPGCLEEAAACQ